MKETPKEFIFDLNTVKPDLVTDGTKDMTGDDISHLCNAIAMTHKTMRRIAPYTVKISDMEIEFKPGCMIIDGWDYPHRVDNVSVRDIIETLIYVGALNLGPYFCNSVYIRYSQFKRKVADKEPIMWLHP